jgi:hypothetical protein
MGAFCWFLKIWVQQQSAEEAIYSSSQQNKPSTAGCYLPKQVTTFLVWR